MRLFLAAALSFLPFHTLAHDAPSGWTYPPGCCYGGDCRPEPLVVQPSGYLLLTTGELVAPSDPRIKPSGDGETHRCGTATITRCIYIPAGV